MHDLLLGLPASWEGPPSAASDRHRGTRRPFLQQEGAHKSLCGPGRCDFFLSLPAGKHFILTKTRQEGEAAYTVAAH